MAIQPQQPVGERAGRARLGQVSDEALAAEAAACRDAEAFAELVRRHQGRVRGYLGKITGNPALADDLAQDTFIRAWDRLSSFRGSGHFAGWLMKIAHNEFLQTLRKSARDTRLEERLGREAAEPELPSTLGGRPDEGVTDLPRFLAVLSDDERAVLVLSYACGCSHAEIVEITGLPLGTVKSHIHRGRARVREAFGLEEAAHG